MGIKREAEREPAPRPHDEECGVGKYAVTHKYQCDECCCWCHSAAASSPVARRQTQHRWSAEEPRYCLECKFSRRQFELLKQKTSVIVPCEPAARPLTLACNKSDCDPRPHSRYSSICKAYPARIEQPTPHKCPNCGGTLPAGKTGTHCNPWPPAAPVAVVEPRRARFIDAEMSLDTVKPYSSGPHPFIPYVVESDHPRFVRGTRLDWGFVSCALQDGYDLQIKAASDCATNLAIADYEERNGKCDWITWRRADSQRKEGAAE